MRKIIITWKNWMLAHDFLKIKNSKFEVFWFDKNELNITNIENIKNKINEINPDIVLNLSAYTNVDDAEDIWMKKNYEINAIWAYNLAKISWEKNIDFINISTDYIFNWENEDWYNENEIANPINQYWMAKFLWEKLTKNENKNAIIIRTSWLYWGWKGFKNFVNTILKLWKEKKELKIIDNQFWIPTNWKDLSEAIYKVIENIEKNRWKIFHFSNESEWKAISWFDFANEIFFQKWIDIKIKACKSSEYKTKAKRPEFSKLNNNSEIKLQNWKIWLKNYLENL